VVTHGTDTLEETAFFLNLTVKTDKPVVIVGSTRPSTAASADGPLNLYNAVGVAADPKARGRGVLVGVASYGHNDFYMSPSWKHTTQTEFDVSTVSKRPRVDIIFASVDMSPDLIDAAAASGARGIAGVGNGNMNKASVTAAANAVQKGVVVVRSSRVVTGVVGRNVEINDDELGFIASDELNPQKSRIS
jgi:L-asparaginase